MTEAYNCIVKLRRKQNKLKFTGFSKTNVKNCKRYVISKLEELQNQRLNKVKHCLEYNKDTFPMNLIRKVSCA